MPRSPALPLCRDPAWTLTAAGDALILSGGADQVFTVPDLAASTMSEVISIWRSPESLDAAPPSAAASRVIEELLAAGILRPPAIPGGLEVDLLWSGPSDAGITAALAADPEVILDGGAGAAVVIRTGGSLTAAAAVGSSLAVPHLLVDCTYAHTVSLGPAVFPGQSACLDCFAARITHAWGDPEPPARPAVLANPVFIAGLVLAEARRLHDGSTSLVNRSVAYDLGAHRIVAGVVHRVPGCARCDPETPVINLWEQLR